MKNTKRNIKNDVINLEIFNPSVERISSNDAINNKMDKINEIRKN